MKAIQVKYISATSSRGSRWKALASSLPPITVPFQYADKDGGAKYAAAMLCEKYGWKWERLVEGQLPNGDMVYCFDGEA